MALAASPYSSDCIFVLSMPTMDSAYLPSLEIDSGPTGRTVSTSGIFLSVRPWTTLFMVAWSASSSLPPSVRSKSPSAPGVKLDGKAFSCSTVAWMDS